MTKPHRYVPSPCIRHCTLNEEDVCVGCGRTLDEIKSWSNAESDEQVKILERSEMRLNQLKHPSDDA